MNEWRAWGPYLSDRQWGTVREDYSHDSEAWDHFPHDAARSRAYRWGEDGIGGWSDAMQRLCLARVRYLHPNGQLPAYEWEFSDVNPPVHAWAAWRAFQIDRKLTDVLERRPNRGAASLAGAPTGGDRSGFR